MLKTILIAIGAVLLLLFLLIMYCALVVASREDDWMEEMHARWVQEQQQKEPIQQNTENVEKLSEKKDQVESPSEVMLT